MTLKLFYMINLTRLSVDYPTWIKENEFNSHIKKNKNGWTNCETQNEWLAKLYYLRQGYKDKKISKSDFIIREKDLVIRWWQKWC